MKHLDYPYKPKIWAMAMVVLVFGVMGWFIAQEAINNDRGMVLNGVIHFSEGGATAVYWCVAVASGLFFIVGISALFVSIFGSHRLVVTSASISAPRSGFSRKPTVVPLSSITSLETQVIQHHRLLIIWHREGKLVIRRAWFPDTAAFDEVCDLLVRFLNNRQG